MKSEPSSNRLAGILSLAFVTALWGLSFPIVKNALELMTPFLFNAYRFDLASLALIGFIFFKKRRITKSAIFLGLGIGISLFLGFSFQTLGLNETSATNSAFLTALSVIFVPFFGIFFGTKLNFKTFVGVLIATIGLWLLTGGNLTALNRGDFFTILCAISFAVQILIVARGSSANDVFVLTASQMVAVACASHLANFIFETNHSIPNTLDGWGYIGFAGIFLSAIPFVVQIQVQRYISAVSAAMIFATEPLWGALAAYVINDERLTFMGYMGGLTMIVGILVVESPPLPKFLKRLRTTP